MGDGLQSLRIDKQLDVDIKRMYQDRKVRDKMLLIWQLGSYPNSLEYSGCFWKEHWIYLIFPFKYNRRLLIVLSTCFEPKPRFFYKWKIGTYIFGDGIEFRVCRSWQKLIRWQLASRPKWIIRSATSRRTSPENPFWITIEKLAERQLANNFS